MKLIRLGEPGSEAPGLLLEDGSRLDVSSFVRDYDEGFFAGGGLSQLRAWLKDNLASTPRVAHSVRLGSPICRPSKIVCIGLNFRDHARESNMEIPKEPVIFFKATTSLVGPNDDLILPKNARKVDWEVELAVVIGKTKLAAAHYNLGRFLFETGKYEEADKELSIAIRLQPDYAGAFYFLALAAKQENEVERSTELLKRVVTLQPDNADAQYLLGQNLEHAGESAAAIQHWKAAVQADPNHSQALYNLAKSLNKIHDPEAKQYQDRFDALQKSQQIADRVSELGNFALEAANAQNWPQAIEQMNEAIQLCGNCPQSAHLHKNLGLFYGRTGNIGEAKKELRTALQLAPNDSDTQNALAMLERAHEEQVK